MKTEWKRKRCGCTKTTLPNAGKVLIRCARHRDKSYDGKRLLCFWDENGIARQA